MKRMKISQENLKKNEKEEYTRARAEPLGRNCRRTLLTQLMDRFFG
jgi:hypothetical protein